MKLSKQEELTKQVKQCVLYARVSLEEQVERFGLSSQRTELRAYAEKHGYSVAKEFIDDGYSGADLGRPALSSLRELVRNRDVSLVVVHDPDRLARKLAHQLILTEELEKFGVRLEFVTTPNTDNMEGRLLLNVRGVIAEYEREKIRERTMRGRREKARQGLIVGGRCPFGYKPVNSTYQVEEADAQVVVRMFRWLVEDQLSIRQIVEQLNQSGYKPYASDRWAKSTVGRILRNEFYTGKGFYNRRQRIEPEAALDNFRRNKKTLNRWRAESDWISQSVPAIIGVELFQAAQERLQQNSAHCSGRPSKTIYLLRGILKCSTCGRKYVGVPVFKDKYYRCMGRERLAEPRCGAPLIAAGKIEPFIWTYVVRLLSNPDLLAVKLAQHQAGNEPELKSELLRLDREIQDIQRKEARLLDALLDDDLPLPGMREKATQLAETKARLRCTRDSVQSRLAVRQDETELKQKVLRYCAVLSSEAPGLEPVSRQKLLRAVLDDVVLEGTQVTIRGILPVAGPCIYRPQHIYRPQRVNDRAARIG